MKFKTSQGIIEIDISATRTKIGIKMTGGLASALLTYMLALYKRDARPDIKLIPIIFIAVAKPYQWVYANMSCRKITELTGVKIEEYQFHATAPILYDRNVIVSNSPSDHVYIAESKFLASLYDNNIIDTHFSGQTLNPPITAFPEQNGRHTDGDGFCGGQTYPTVIHNDADQHQLTDRLRRKLRYMPFVNVDNKAIHELYMLFDVLDDLFPLTYSCENYNEHTMAQLDLSKHCGLNCCWGCQERLWAFGKLDALTEEQILPSAD